MRAVLTVVVLLAWAPPAWAGGVAVKTSEVPAADGGTATISYVEFIAAPGEANDVLITGGDRSIRVEDAGAPLIAGARCYRDGAAAVCAPGAPGFLYVSALGGDGDDHIVAANLGLLTAQLNGGTGNDHVAVIGGPGRLIGGEGDDTLLGGEMHDDLDPGPGADVVRAGAGNDQIDDGGGPTTDRIDGGPGPDTVSYAGRTQPLHVDLGHSGHDGEAGERDTLIDVEDVTGGSGADVLAGDDGPNSLDGGGGGDKLVGRRGDDTLEGSGAADRLRGGDGADVLLGDGGADRFDGGPGADDYAVSGASRVRCSGAEDAVALGAGVPRVGASCPRVLVRGVALELRRDAHERVRSVAARYVDHGFLPQCRMRLTVSGRRFTLRGLRRTRVRRVAPKRDALFTVAFSHGCGGAFHAAARFRA